MLRKAKSFSDTSPSGPPLSPEVTNHWEWIQIFITRYNALMKFCYRELHAFVQIFA